MEQLMPWVGGAAIGALLLTISIIFWTVITPRRGMESVPSPRYRCPPPPPPRPCSPDHDDQGEMFVKSRMAMLKMFEEIRERKSENMKVEILIADIEPIKSVLAIVMEMVNDDRVPMEYKARIAKELMGTMRVGGDTP